MSIEIERSALEAALELKGFEKCKDCDHHRVYIYKHDGKLVKQLRTRVSHGSKYKTYDKGLSGAVKRQRHLDSPDELTAFVNCPLTKELYEAKLKAKQII